MQHRIVIFSVSAALAMSLAGAAYAGPNEELIDLSGVGIGQDEIPGVSFDFHQFAATSQDPKMSMLVVDLDTEGGSPNPTPAPLPVSGAMGAVGLGVLAMRRRRRGSL